MRSHHRDEDRAAVLRMAFEARDFVLERAFHLMLWGGLFMLLHGLESAAGYGLLSVAAVMREGIYVALMVGVSLGSYLFERYHAVNPVNILSRTLLVLWGAVGFALLVIDFLGGVTRLADPGPRGGSMAVVIALGFAVSSSLIVRRGPRLLAAFWGVLAVVFFFLDPLSADFLLTSAFCGGLFLPGLCLYAVHWSAQRKKRPI